MHNDPYFHVGYAPKINSGNTHNIKFQKTCLIVINLNHRLCATRSVDELQWESFLKFYVMDSPGIDLFGISHVKVGFIPVLKMYALPILEIFDLNYWICTMWAFMSVLFN